MLKQKNEDTPFDVSSLLLNLPYSTCCLQRLAISIPLPSGGVRGGFLGVGF